MYYRLYTFERMDGTQYTVELDPYTHIELLSGEHIAALDLIVNDEIPDNNGGWHRLVQ